MRQHEPPTPALLPHPGPGQQRALGTQKCHSEGRAGNFGCWCWRECAMCDLSVAVKCQAQQLRSCLLPLWWTAESLYGDRVLVFGALPWQDGTKPCSATTAVAPSELSIPQKAAGKQNNPKCYISDTGYAASLPHFWVKKPGKPTLSFHFSAYK